MSVVKQFLLEDEYKKGTGIRKEDIQRFREWLKKQPHLPEEHITDLDLVLAYNCCDRSLETAKRLLDLNLTLRTMFTSLFEDRVCNRDTENFLKSALVKPLPVRSRDGYATLYVNFLDKDPKKFVLFHILRAMLMIIDLWQYEDGAWPGLLVILDLSSIGIGHLSCFEYKILHQYFQFLKEAMFLKLKAIHVINAPPFMDKIMALLNMVSRVPKLFHVHNDGYKSLDNIYALDNLPKDIGGGYMTFEECINDTIAKLKAGAEYFQLESKKRVCESRRPGKLKTNFFGGVVGLFKKLDID